MCVSVCFMCESVCVVDGVVEGVYACVVEGVCVCYVCVVEGVCVCLCVCV